MKAYFSCNVVELIFFYVAYHILYPFFSNTLYADCMQSYV